jgi:LysR family transcriptional regulator for bpeEF and oprC
MRPSREPVGFFAESEPSPYWQVIAREYAERFIHQSQIRRAVGAPELDGELVTSAARVVVHALSAWLRDYEPAPLLISAVHPAGRRLPTKGRVFIDVLAGSFAREPSLAMRVGD